jgi:hypothetical protein
MKGQYFSFDAVIGASIFILTLVAIMSYWYGVSSSIEQQQSSLAKEAIRVADIIYSPTEVPYGITMGWDDKRISRDKVEYLCAEYGEPSEVSELLDSQYGVVVDFNVREDRICIWPNVLSISSNEIYKIRRTGTFIDSEGNSETGYLDIYIFDVYSVDAEAGEGGVVLV